STSRWAQSRWTSGRCTASPARRWNGWRRGTDELPSPRMHQMPHLEVDVAVHRDAFSVGKSDLAGAEKRGVGGGFYADGLVGPGAHEAAFLARRAEEKLRLLHRAEVGTRVGDEVDVGVVPLPVLLRRGEDVRQKKTALPRINGAAGVAAGLGDGTHR